MKKSILLLLLVFIGIIVPSALFSQESNLKYGKISEQELNMSVYPNDTSAVAVVLYDIGSTYFDVLSNKFKIFFEYQKRIKILKQEGTGYADIEIPYHYFSSSSRDMVSGLEAYAYNMEDGKIVKTKLEKKYIFEEELSKRLYLIKFSIPNVKVGTVIEYKYKVTSDYVSNIPNWKIQGNIPVQYSKYDVRIPEYFLFNISIKGFEPIKVNEIKSSLRINLGVTNSGMQTLTCSTREITYTANDVPALKQDSYIWCMNDFLSGVVFELKGTHYPNDFYRPYSQTWSDLEKMLKEESDFGSNIKMSNPFKDELRPILKDITDETQKIEAIYAFVKNRIRWNDTYSFSGNKARDAVKNGMGDNGQINMVLISVLKDAGINAVPVLISRRSHGRLPYTYPSYEQLNTFVVAAQTTDDKIYYLDGSATYGGLSVLPTDLLVDRGFVYGDTKFAEWVDLSKATKNQQIVLYNMKLSEEGLLTGDKSVMMSNQYAYTYKSAYFAAKDSADYLEKMAANDQIIIDDFSHQGMDKISNRVTEKVAFTKEMDLQGDFIYLNPMIFTHIKDNPFTQSERKLPVEFSFPFTYQQTTTITIPDGFEVEELPQSIRIVLDNDKGSCLYQIVNNGNTVQLSYRFIRNEVVFTVLDYPSLRDFYGQVAQKNNEMIVLKRKTAN